MNQVLSLIEEEMQDDPSVEMLFLKINIKGGGCSGFQYQFSLKDQKGINDRVFNILSDGQVSKVSLIVDHFSMIYLQGAVVDFKEDGMGARFIIDNPNATTTCSCGDSFAVD
jgi:iron-sulfur cluster insertion protein